DHRRADRSVTVAPRGTDDAGASSPEAPARPATLGARLIGNGSLGGLLVKISLRGLFTALGIWAVLPLYLAQNWWGIGLVVLVVAFVYWVYLSKRTVPAKYLVPGVLFLMAFQILPVLYTMGTSLTNMSDGHRGSKEQAIASIDAFSVVRGEYSPEYGLTVVTTGDPSPRDMVGLLADDEQITYAGDAEGLPELSCAEVDPDTGKCTEALGYTILAPAEVNARSDELEKCALPTADGAVILS